jgi:hypothetical protein
MLPLDNPGCWRTFLYAHNELRDTIYSATNFRMSMIVLRGKANRLSRTLGGIANEV